MNSRSRRLTEVNVELSNALTPEVFSLMVEKLISYITYNSNQMPVNFDILRGLMRRRRSRMTELADTEEFSKLYRELECGGRYHRIEQIYDAYEATFSNIQQQLVNDREVREIVIVVGLPLMPKHVYVITVPQLVYSDPNPLSNCRRSLCQLFRCLVPTMSFIPFERNMLETFVYLGLDNSSTFNSDWFTPKRFFLHSKTPLTTINFNITSDSVESIASRIHNFHIHEDKRVSIPDGGEADVSMSEDGDAQSAEAMGSRGMLPTAFFQTSDDNWFGGKVGLKGFRDENIKGELLLRRLERLLNR